MNEKGIRVMIFGVFDGLHDGHKFFIEKAQEYGDELHIIVTQDEVVNRMKGYFPEFNLFQRMNTLQKNFPKAILSVGDQRLNRWTHVKIQKPDIVVCGYDQKKLAKALKQIGPREAFKIIELNESLKGNTLHSRLIKKNKSI